MLFGNWLDLGTFAYSFLYVLLLSLGESLFLSIRRTICRIRFPKSFLDACLYLSGGMQPGVESNAPNG